MKLNSNERPKQAVFEIAKADFERGSIRNYKEAAERLFRVLSYLYSLSVRKIVSSPIANHDDARFRFQFVVIDEQRYEFARQHSAELPEAIVR